MIQVLLLGDSLIASNDWQNRMASCQVTNLPYNTIPSLNCHIEALTKQTGCCYLNIHSRLKNLSVPIFEADGIHVTKKTYEIWSRTLLEHIAFLIEDD